MRILIVEDEKKVASFIRKGLEEQSYAVDTAFDGLEGERLALQNAYDAVILDVLLPKQDGVYHVSENQDERCRHSGVDAHSARRYRGQSPRA